MKSSMRVPQRNQNHVFCCKATVPVTNALCHKGNFLVTPTRMTSAIANHLILLGGSQHVMAGVLFLFCSSTKSNLVKIQCWFFFPCFINMWRRYITPKQMGFFLNLSSQQGSFFEHIFPYRALSVASRIRGTAIVHLCCLVR